MTYGAKAVHTPRRTITARVKQAEMKICERDGKLWALHPTKGWRPLKVSEGTP